jgi:hypothetical protein
MPALRALAACAVAGPWFSMFVKLAHRQSDLCLVCPCPG